ncbi:TIM-barrel domain-containing protein [Paenibacillus sp. NAIST15-1]|uniref:glycoside hydrolase family 31 protein n=1 Tax=Paenibacillus sp. NAIST15-1 TaxID=1605994 RepID=UPI00086C328B|nr:TIM-barrel domain-containing protein [Paenibacillus sp. NAIST15-1]GAV12357.1 alpha-glucosidase 2 [Paenibacillus sp. NAIST15-1]
MQDTSAAIHPDNASEQTHTQTGVQLGAISRVAEQDGSLWLVGKYFNLAITSVGAGVIRIKTYRGHQPDWKTSPAIVNKDSRIPQAMKWSTTEEFVSITIGHTLLEVNRQSGAFRISNESQPNVELVSLQRNRESVGDYTAFVALDKDDHIYGLGEKTGFLDKRGERYTMWNSDVYAPHVPEMEALYQSIPFLTVLNQGNSYGLFLDNPGKTVFDMRTFADMAMMQTWTGEFDLYWIEGPSMKDVIIRYGDLTGRMPLPPKWALGYHQSRYSYMDEQEVLNLAHTFREKEIPCDVIHLDIHYMNGYRVFTFDENRFPNPKDMMEQLKELGFHIVPIVDPGVKKDPLYAVYMEGVDNDYYCKTAEGEIYTGPVWPGESAFPDFTESRVRDWWKENQRFYTDLGIDGIWNDMNEPAIFNETKTMDVNVMHGNEGDRKTHGEIHNLYGMFMSQASYEGLKALLEGKRPFVLTRAGYSGVQRYAAVWTGDNRSFWEHMSMAMPMVLNLGVSGVPFAGPDIGGFAHHTSGELLARWTQMGVFFPYVRNHSAIDMLRQEPWSFGEEIEKICQQYISMRYEWMPYLYHWFYEASTTGLPFMRPLVLEYPTDPEVYNLCDQFLVGDSVIIAPIYRPNTQYRSVYLPEGEWVDYWSGKRFAGKQHIHVHAPLEKLPIFVRSGAILLQGPVRQHAGEKAAEEYVAAVAYLQGAGHTSQLEWYEDDGLTFEYENGKWNKMLIQVTESEQSIQLSAEYTTRGYESERDSISFRLIGLAAAPKSVGELGESVSAEQLAKQASGWSYDAASQELRVKLPESAVRIELNVTM